jgi:hypothetical protein
MTTSTQIRRVGVAVLTVVGVALSAGCGGESGSGASVESGRTAGGRGSVAAAQARYNAYARAHRGDPGFAGKEVRNCYVDPSLTAQSQGIAPGSVAYDCQLWVVDVPRPFFLANTWFALEDDGTVLPY